MDYKVVSAIVVPVAVLGAANLAYVHDIEQLGKRPARTATLLLAVVAYVTLTVLLLTSTTEYDPWWVLPPYIGIPVCSLFWCVQWDRKLGLGRLASILTAASTFALWGVIAHSTGLVRQRWLLGLTTIIYMHAFFYEFWIEGHRLYFK